MRRMVESGSMKLWLFYPLPSPTTGMEMVKKQKLFPYKQKTNKSNLLTDKTNKQKTNTNKKQTNKQTKNKQTNKKQTNIKQTNQPNKQTNKQTPWSRVLPEELTGPQLVSILSQLDPVPIPTPQLLKIYLNIVLPSTPGSSK
jgi:hypothetical protein